MIYSEIVIKCCSTIDVHNLVQTSPQMRPRQWMFNDLNDAQMERLLDFPDIYSGYFRKSLNKFIQTRIDFIRKEQNKKVETYMDLLMN